MATSVITYNFTSNAEGFSFTPASNATGAWSSSGGYSDNGGCLNTDNSGRNKTDTGAWTQTLTFADMGIPAGANVTGITSATFQSKVITWNTATSLTIGPVTLGDGSTTVTLGASRSPTGTEGSYVQHSGVDNTSLSWTSSTSVTITIPHNAVNGNNAAAQIQWYGDALVFTVTYTTGYDITAGAGSYSGSGVSTGLLANRLVSAASGSYSGSGTTAAITATRKLTAGAGSYSGSGQSAGFSGRVFAVVYDGSLGEPSAAQIKAGQDINGTAADFAGNKAATASQAETIGASGLTPEGLGYKASFVWWDGDAESNLQTTARWYALQASVGTLSIAGQASGVAANRLLTASSGTAAYTGQAAGFLGHYVLTAGAGTYAGSGQAAGLAANRLLTAAAGAYAGTGYAAGLTYAAGYTLTAGAGTYAGTGYAAGILATRALTAAAGAYAGSGQAAGLTYSGGKILTAAAGTLAFTGHDVVSKLTYTVVYDSALGEPSTAQIKAGQDVNGDPAVYAAAKPTTATATKTFGASGLTSGDYYKASFAWSDGTDFSNVQTTAAFRTALALSAEAGTFARPGYWWGNNWWLEPWWGDSWWGSENVAGLRVSRLLTAAAGTFTGTGQQTGLSASRSLVAASGTLTAIGHDAVLTASTGLIAEAGTFTGLGNDAGLLRNLYLSALPGSFTGTGYDAAGLAGRYIAADAGTAAFTGHDAAFIYLPTGAYRIVAEAGAFAGAGQDIVVFGPNAGILNSRSAANAKSYNSRGVQTVSARPAQTYGRRPGA